MTRRWIRFWLPLLLLATLAGCQTPTIRNAAPPIQAVLGDVTQPKADVLPIVKSKPVAGNAQKAIKNYRELLKLNPDPATRKEALRRIADLQVQVQDQKGNPTSGVAKVDQSIDTYRELLAKNPGAPGNDRLLYQLARAYQNTGKTPEAIVALKRLEQKYPNSSLMGDAHFRAGELLFQTKRYAEAAREYRIVMDLGADAPFFRPARYKYGWSLFKQRKFTEAIASFFKILDHDLPPGKPVDPDKALAKVDKSQVDMAKDSLRVVGLSFAALGGGPAINAYYDKHGEPRFFEMVYNALGEMLLKKQRYTDAAKAYAAFITRHPKHADAPGFQTKVIGAYKAGGFGKEVLRETERYANTYSPDDAYWAGKKPTAAVLAELHKDLQQIGRHYQAKADAEKSKDQKAARDKDFATAASWYRRFLKAFPNDGDAPGINFSLADSLYDGGQTRKAALEYEQTAYGYKDYPKAGDAALAAVQAWQRLAKEVPAAKHADVLRKSATASEKLADTFPDHPKWVPVLTQAALDLYTVKDLDRAIRDANRVLNSSRQVPDKMRRTALGVVADSRFAQKNYAAAETAYTKVLKLTAATDPLRKRVVEQLATSIYRQGEAARKAGKLQLAADTFLRIDKVVPKASIRPTADYDAAAALMGLKDWPRAETVLETFRKLYPQHELIPDVDKKLAVAYQSDGKPEQAAFAYQRIARRTTETAATRRAAAWQAAQLFDKAKRPDQASEAYAYYVQNYPAPLDQAMDARKRLADIAHAAHDQSKYRYWLQNIIDADHGAGAARDMKSRTLAAHASLVLARDQAGKAMSIALTQPLKTSLAAKKTATESAVQRLQDTIGYGIAEDATAATYLLGEVYENFSQSLLASQRPNISGTELDQYNLLLEEKAEPFIDQAIKAHEANLAHVGEGLYDSWIARSVAALGRLAPGKYGKREKSEASYDTLQ